VEQNVDNLRINEQMTQAGASGLKTNLMRPLTAGKTKTVLDNSQSNDGAFSWGFLDKVSTSVANAVTPALTGWINSKTGNNDSPAALNTTRGTESDQPSAGKPAEKEMTFYAKNKMPILVGGGLLLAAVLFKFARG
jgi:hypothetical protein